MRRGVDAGGSHSRCGADVLARVSAQDRVMTTIHASRPLDVPTTTTDAAPPSPGASVLTAGLSLLAVLGIFAGAAALIGLAFRATLGFFVG